LRPDGLSNGVIQDLHQYLPTIELSKKLKSTINNFTIISSHNLFKLHYTF